MALSAPIPRSLEFLDSGASQHVFVSPSAAGVVWKIPAVYPELLPSPMNVRSFRPTRPWKAAVWRAALRVLPALLPKGETALGWHLRQRRLRRFQIMLRLLRRLAARGAVGGVLPCDVVQLATVRLSTPQGERVYRGPALVQRRADLFITREVPPGFDSLEVVRIQQRLWREGVGLDDADAVLGPHNWAMLDGRVYLADTGSLTDRRARVRAVLDSRSLDDTAELVVNRCSTAAARANAEAHLASVRALLRPAVFDACWRTPAAAAADQAR